MIPRCFESAQQFRSWMKAARLTKGLGKAKWCVDCTASYQAKMLAEGRCDCPHILFGIDRDGMESGYLPPKSAEKGYVPMKMKRANAK